VYSATGASSTGASSAGLVSVLQPTNAIAATAANINKNFFIIKQLFDLND
jgi:hypothetical protein